jgi:dienelactone hydrolase
LYGQAPPPPAPPYRPADSEWRALRLKTGDLRARIDKLVTRPLAPDAEVYIRAVELLLRFPEECYTKAYFDHALTLLETAAGRAAELERGEPSWPKRTGRLSRAYRSRVDGTVQPYALLIPDSYDASRPTRLDVVLHGRGATLTEVSFLAAHDSPKPLPAEQDFIQLEVFGRGNNAYRWAGETDVFEALEAVRAHYNIDARRIVLRGFSMGGAGAWHIGLHHPDRWAAVEAGAGFTESRRYARLAGLPPWQEKLLHIYDAVDYSLNAFNVPVVGYGGDQDPQLQASRNIQNQIGREGLPDLRALFLVGPQTGHRFHPDSKAQSEEFIRSVLAGPRPADRIRFVTYTTRYNRCFWVTIDGLEQHYERAELDASRTASEVRVRTTNVAGLTLAEIGGRAVVIDGQRFVPADNTLSLARVQSVWRTRRRGEGLRKVSGLQGPIDDAFMDSFLCVRPGKPHPESTATLERFAREYAKWMRGEVRIKDDRAVTSEDIANHNLILFGDAATNRVIARIAGRLPRMPVLVYPNPLNPRRYVVLNSGHTFGEREFRGTNALLFPRLGDWSSGDASGFFDEAWRMAASTDRGVR